MKFLFCIALLLVSSFSIGQQQLIGNSNVNTNLDTNPAGRAEAFRTKATASGKLTTMGIYLDATNKATKVQIGVYNNTGGTNGWPNKLIGSGTINNPVNGAWNTVTIASPPQVTAGSIYHIGILGLGGDLKFKDSATGGHMETFYGNVTSLPVWWGTGYTFASTNPSVYGSSTSVPVVSITISPTSATVLEGNTQQFTALVSGTSNTAVNWSVQSGTGSVNSTGLFTAPNVVENDTVRAQSQADTTKTASAIVTVQAPVVNHTVDLGWSDPDPVTFNVYRGQTSGGPYTMLASGLGAPSFVDSAVNNGQTYYYVVTAVTTDGESGYSNQASVVIP